jgi:hypothetical protein
VFSVVTETADTRSWSLLPAAFDVSHVRLAPGKYKVEIFSDGKLQDVRDVTIVKDQTVLMRARGDNP